MNCVGFDDHSQKLVDKINRSSRRDVSLKLKRINKMSQRIGRIFIPCIVNIKNKTITYGLRKDICYRILNYQSRTIISVLIVRDGISENTSEYISLSLQFFADFLRNSS
jgi:hypothetical protein